MAFSDYKNIAQVQTEFQIRYQEAHFIVSAPLQPSPVFLEEFAFSLENIDVFTSEGARTEAIIFPILREVYKGFHEQYSFWIQKAIAFNDKLSGTPDYLFGTKSPLGKTVLELPLVLIVEAKKNDFEQGWGQCLAELIAAQKLNNSTEQPIVGVVTDGKLWEFGKLVGSDFTRNAEGFTVDDLPQLFGALRATFEMVSKNHA
jgi:hypothetical protein